MENFKKTKKIGWGGGQIKKYSFSLIWKNVKKKKTFSFFIVLENFEIKRFFFSGGLNILRGVPYPIFYVRNFLVPVKLDYPKNFTVLSLWEVL